MSSSRVHIGNIPENLAEADLYQFLTSADIHPTTSNAHCVTSTRSGAKNAGNTGRYIVITFESDAEASHAIDHINYLTLTIDKRNYQLNASPFIPDFRMRKQNGTGNIIIHNLPPDIEKISLKEAYSNFGRVLSSYVKTCDPLPIDSRKKDTGREPPAEPRATPAKVGYVMFETDEEAADAIASTDGKFLGKNQVRVQKYLTIEQRTAQERRVYLRGIREEVTPQQLQDYIEAELGPDCLQLAGNDIKLRPDTRGEAGGNWTVLECSSHDYALRLVSFLNREREDKKDAALVPYSAMYETRGLRARSAAQKLTAMRKTYIDSKRNLSVYNLNPSVTKEQIVQFFSQYGAVQSVGLPFRGDKARQGEPDPSCFHANILFETVDAASNALASAADDEAKLEQRLARDGMRLDVRYYVQSKGAPRSPEPRTDMTAIALPAAMQAIYGGAPAQTYYSALPTAAYMVPPPGYPLVSSLEPPL